VTFSLILHLCLARRALPLPPPFAQQALLTLLPPLPCPARKRTPLPFVCSFLHLDTSPHRPIKIPPPQNSFLTFSSLTCLFLQLIPSHSVIQSTPSFLPIPRPPLFFVVPDRLGVATPYSPPHSSKTSPVGASLRLVNPRTPCAITNFKRVTNSLYTPTSPPPFGISPLHQASVKIESSSHDTFFPSSSLILLLFFLPPPPPLQNPTSPPFFNRKSLREPPTSSPPRCPAHLSLPSSLFLPALEDCFPYQQPSFFSSALLRPALRRSLIANLFFKQFSYSPVPKVTHLNPSFPVLIEPTLPYPSEHTSRTLPLPLAARF